MNFNSLQFLAFLLIVLVLYWLLPHKFRWAMLLAASYYFYMSWNVWLIFLIVGTTVVSYVAAILISRTDKKPLKKLWLSITLIICLGALIFFKYFNFLIASVIDFLNLFTLNIDSFALDIILPVGISFYTFQTLSYVIDVYRGKFKPEMHFGYYALFVCYFPQLVAGPIERPNDLIPQLRAEHKLDYDDFSVGFRIMLVGFFRKCVIADFFGTFVNTLYSDISNATSLSVIIVGILFILQIYNDFAGYSEIATGVARMMGVKLTKNFDSPFVSLSLTEFFRRWHITLNRWFIDYLYIPLGGSRKGKVRTILNTFIVFILSGLWHGANWTYALWGMLSAVVITIEIILRGFKKSEKPRPEYINYLKRFGLMMFFALTSILFRAQSIAQYGQLLVKVFTGFPSDFMNATFNSMGMTVLSLFQIVITIVCMNMITAFGKAENTHLNKSLPINRMGECAAVYAQRVSTYLYLILVIALCWIASIGTGASSAFLYFQF